MALSTFPERNHHLALSNGVDAFINKNCMMMYIPRSRPWKM